MNTTPASLLELGRGRHRHAKAFKAELVAQCHGRSVWMYRVAMSHGINANLLHPWIVEFPGQACAAVGDAPSSEVRGAITVDPNPSPIVRRRDTTQKCASFIQTTMLEPERSDLDTEIAHGDICFKVTQPIDASAA